MNIGSQSMQSKHVVFDYIGCTFNPPQHLWVCKINVTQCCKRCKQHFGMKRFFIKFMINTLCTMFPSNFGRNSLVCGSYTRALEKKKTLTFDWVTPFIVPLSFYNTLNIKNLMCL